MAKKYLSLERLTEYDELIKGEITDGDASTLASAKSYTDTEVGELSAQVAYINLEDNEDVRNPDIVATSITIDSALSETSTNPVQNKVVNAKFAEMEEEIANIGGSSTGGSGGGSEPYIIKYETDWVNGGETLIDGNYADAKAAFLGGRLVFFNQYNFYYMASELNPEYISATYFETGMDGFTGYTLLLTPDNKIETYHD